MGGGFRLRLDWPGTSTGFGQRLSLVPDSELRLQLDPQIMAEVRALAETGSAPRIRQLWLTPNWSQLAQMPSMARILASPPPRASEPLVPRGRGPATPRAAELSDLMQAIWAVPAVRQAATRTMDEVTGQLRRGWDRSSATDRAIIITHGIVLAGTALGPMLAHSEHRRMLLNLIDGTQVPIPGYPGASVRVGRQGGGVTLPVPRVPQVVASGSIDREESGRTRWQVMIRVDVASLLRSAGVDM